MATTKPRINVSFSAEVEQLLERIAKRDQMPVATKVADLVHNALEIEEDVYWAGIADMRKQKDTGKRTSHARAWSS